MKKLTGAQIRDTWIEFFKSKGHQFLPGVNLIPDGDKSLLWVNAGVTGLKKYFDGSEIPPCRRIVNVQKSIRTNDIENVGHTARHHTFFEMLGNFSIGDYFRKEVIGFAMEILTSPKWFDMPVEKIYVTYNPSDLETFKLWQEVGLPADHLVPLEGNYWQIGEGPCGPNTEVFFDRGEAYDPDHIGIKLLQDDMENDRYIEIWGIVFSQYNAVNGVRREDYKELPSKNIDTGSGLERLACIMQGTETNFETDLFWPIVEATKKLCGNKPYEGSNLMSYRVIADHARCLTFALSDGAYFSNEGRGYVLRRIIRRAMRYGQKLGINEPFMYKLVSVVADNYRNFYPELSDKIEFVSKMIAQEEEKFLRTLSSGEEKLRQMIEGKKVLPGADIFKLYDTFGFPSDLTKEICLESGVEADMEGFEEAMEEQKNRARAARGDIESFHKQSKDLLEFKTPSEFTYDPADLVSKVTGIFVDGVRVNEIEEDGEVAFEVNNFYAESGGQVSDKGTIHNGNCEAVVLGVSKAPSGQHLLHVHINYGSIHEGDEFTLSIDKAKRELTARNHSATHLLHAALGEVLGFHVDQKGSYVDEEYLRFDYSSLSRPTEEQLSAIEELVNQKISEAIAEVTEVLPLEEAKKIGAEMEFSEKYGDFVRVVEFGEFSKEFCGGTHVSNSRDIGLFVIESESSVASGIRRIVGRTSLGAYHYLATKKKILSSMVGKLGNPVDSLAPSRLDALQEDLDNKRKEIEALKAKIAAAQSKSLTEEFKVINEVYFLLKRVDGERNDLMKLGDNLKVKYQDYLIVLVSNNGEKKALVAFAGGKGKDILPAGNAIKLIAPLLGGNGGGKPEMASGSASDLAKFEQAREALEKKLGE